MSPDIQYPVNLFTVWFINAHVIITRIATISYEVRCEGD